MIHFFVTNKDFVVAEQETDTRYTLHVFVNQIQFQNWLKAQPYPKPKMVHRRTARGRQFPPIDHRNEFEFSWL
jgi:hypothetical protein